MQDPETNRPVDADCNSESAERRAFPGRPYDLLPIGHMAASLGGRLLRVNPNLAAMLGCAGEEELHRWCNGAAQNLFEESTDWNALVSLAKTRGELVRYPAIMRQRGGTILPCMVWARLSPWPWAGVKAVELVVQSMAERHQAFSALTQVLRLYRDMMDLNPDPVLIHEQKRIMLANRAAEAFFGFSKPGALVGRVVEDLLDSSCLDAVNRHIQTAVANLSAEEEFQVVLAGGAVRWLRNYSTRITFHGKPAILTLLHDRTERKKAEEALTQAERLHRTVVDTSPDPTFFQDNGLILYANAAFAQFLGLPVEAGDLAGRRIRDLLHPDTLPVLRDRHATILRCHGPTEAEYDVRLLSGEVRRVETRSVKADYEGRPAVLTVFRDLTERRLAEASLAQAERIHRLMAESAPDPTFFHEDGYLLHVNPATAAFMGAAAPEALVGRSLFELFREDMVPLLRARIQEILETAGVSEAEYALLLPDGSEKFVLARSTRVEFEGRPAILSVLHDQTDRRRAEAALAEAQRFYRVLVDSLPEAVCLHDDGRILYANPCQRQLLAPGDASDLCGRHLTEFLHPDMLPLYERRRAEVLAGRGETMEEYPVRYADGRLVHVAEKTVPVEVGGRPAFLAIVRDISDRVEAERARDEVELLHRTIVETLPEPVFIHKDRRVLFASPAVAGFFNIGSAEELVGLGPEGFLPPDSAAAAHAQLDKTDARGGFWEGELDVSLLNGEARRIWTRTIPVTYQGEQCQLTVLSDLTAYHAAQQAREEAEDIYQAMVENSPSPMCIVEPGRFLVANQALADFYQVGGVDELLGMTMEDLVDAESAARIRTAGMAVLQGEGIRDSTSSLRLRGGDLRYCHSVAVPILYQGRTCMLVSMRDLTAHRLAEQALAEAEHLYRTIVENSPHPIAIHTPDGLLYGNPALARFYRRDSVEELMRTPLAELVDDETGAWLVARIRHMFEQNVGGKDVDCLRLRSGEVLHHQVSTVPIQYQGRRCLLSLMSDLTEHRLAEEARAEAEQLYRTIVETSPHPISIHRPGEMVYGNRALAKFFGLSSIEEFEQKPLEELVGEEEAARLNARCQSLFDSKRAREGLLTIHLLGGEERHVHVASVPIQYQGRPCLLSIISDLTAHRLAEQALAEAEKLYRTIVETSPDPIFIYTLEGLLYANQAAADFYQVPTVAEFMRKSLDDLVDEESAVRLKARIKALAEGTADSRSISTVRLRSGEERHSHVAAVPIKYLGRPSLLTILHDLTGHHLAEQARAEAEQLYRTIVETSPYPIAIHTPDGLVYGNPALARFYCLSSVDELMRTPLVELVDDEDGRRIMGRIRDLFAGKTACIEMDSLRLRSGEVRHHQVSTLPIKYQGRPCLLTILNDLTEHRRAEAERDQALERYEDLFQSAPLGVVLHIPAHNYRRVNRRMAEIFGYPSPEAMVQEVGTDPSCLYVDPADYSRLLRLLENQGEVKDFECLARRRNGDLFWASRSHRAIRGPDGKMQGYQAFVQDITERRRAQSERDLALESYEHLFQAAPLGIAVYVPGEGYTRVNRRMAELFGYPSPEILAQEVGDDPSRLYADPSDHARLRRLSRDRGEVRDFEYLALRRDGSTFWASRSVRMVTAPDGARAGYESFVRDITERRRAQEEAAQRGRRVQVLAGELAMASERERRGMARALHDGPVQQLALATLLVEDLSRRLGSGKEFLPSLDLLRDAADQLRSIMDDLTPPALFSDSLAGTLACLGRDFFSRHGLKVEVSCPGLPGLSREGVAFLCRTVRELLVNAIKHGRAGQARVLVDVRGASLWLTVMDDGKGFDTFLLDAREPRSQGLPGLRSLCRDLGGGLAVESAPGQGTRVVLDLPLDPLCAAHPLV